MVYSSADPIRKPHITLRSKLVVVACLILAFVLAAIFLKITQHSNLRDAQRAVAEQRMADAESLARSWIEHHPHDAEGLILLASILEKRGALFEAIECLQKVPDSSGPIAIDAQLTTAKILIHQCRLSKAETILRRIDPLSSHRSNIDRLWIQLLSLSGRKWESLPYLRRTIDASDDQFAKLLALADSDEMTAPSSEAFARMLKIGDPLASLGCGRIFAANERMDVAMQYARHCLTSRPELIEAQALLGTLLLNAGDLDGFDRWNNSLPTEADEHPAIWFLRGQREQDSGKRQVAIRCYWEVLRRQPNHVRATYQLAQQLVAEGLTAEAATTLERANWLSKFADLSRLIELRSRQNGRIDAGQAMENGFADCAQLAYRLGRLQECRGWCEQLRSIAPGNASLSELESRLSTELGPETPWILPASDLAARFNLSSFPLPKSNKSAEESPHSMTQAKSGMCQIAFEDDASRLGIKFVYFNGEDPSLHGKRTFEYTGGGVAAIDYDHDGWCDLYLTQGTSWPPDPSNGEYLDIMYRNVAGEKMIDVSSPVGIQDVGFGQGLSAGDYNNDGFPDLYVANIGGNRLYQNQGDGTFLDVTRASGLAGHPHWTTTCMIADLNGDSLPDIYDVTFLHDEDLFTRICADSKGRAASCPPGGIPAAPDHVFMSLGDGRFVDKTQDWGFDVPNGDGLGIVAGDFDNSGQISIFVGNDGRANFFFVPQTTANGDLHFNEAAVWSGLAFDEAGAPHASMGIGAGDANNDGLVDLFVTNHYNESNTLYLNLGERAFRDTTRSKGLREPSWLMLGFGAQFIDADRDGWEDIVLTNGHVDNFEFEGIPYKMRPQFFQNQKSRFVERFANEIGSFFDQPALGRGLAKLDWNRDGLNDVAISKIGDPAALLTNRTRNAGRGLGIVLVGTKKSRDAIGTRVIVSAPSIKLTRQLTGGDGYQASNEHRLEFGLGELPDRVDVEIHWPGGGVEKFLQIDINREYLAIEGRSELLQMRVE